MASKGGSEAVGRIVAFVVIQTDLAGHIANDEIFTPAPVNIFDLALIEFLSATKLAFRLFHILFSSCSGIDKLGWLGNIKKLTRTI